MRNLHRKELASCKDRHDLDLSHRKEQNYVYANLASPNKQVSSMV